MFVCLLGFLFFMFSFVQEFSSHSRIFHSYGDVTIKGEGLQIWTYARHSWPLSREDSLTCHTDCDTEHPFTMVISRELWHTCNYLVCHGREAIRFLTIPTLHKLTFRWYGLTFNKTWDKLLHFNLLHIHFCDVSLALICSISYFKIRIYIIDLHIIKCFLKIINFDV